MFSRIFNLLLSHISAEKEQWAAISPNTFEYEIFIKMNIDFSGQVDRNRKKVQDIIKPKCVKIFITSKRGYRDLIRILGDNESADI